MPIDPEEFNKKFSDEKPPRQGLMGSFRTFLIVAGVYLMSSAVCALMYDEDWSRVHEDSFDEGIKSALESKVVDNYPGEEFTIKRAFNEDCPTRLGEFWRQYEVVIGSSIWSVKMENYCVQYDNGSGEVLEIKKLD